jgi:hypothetical protein
VANVLLPRAEKVMKFPRRMINSVGVAAGLLLIAAASMTPAAAQIPPPAQTPPAVQPPAAAQTASSTATSAPDKSGYTLFDPTPDDQLRAFCTDRPPKANLPCTVDAGHFQYESDLFNWTYVHQDGVTENTYLFTNPTLKLGLTNTIDLELNMAPFETVTTKSAQGRQTLTGVGDLYVRVKVNLVGPEGGDFQLAIIPYVKAPTANPGIGNKAVEGGMIVPISFALPLDWTLVFDPEVDILRNAANDGRHANFQNVANLSHALSSSVTGYIELWGQLDNDPASTTKQASLDLALSWVAWADLPNLQFDVGTNIGLTSATPRVQAFVGISQRF